MAEDSTYFCSLQFLPDDLLLRIFSHLCISDLARASYTCHRWFEVSQDDLLWKHLFYKYWHIDSDVPMAPGKSSWRSEYKRLHHYTPKLESEVIKEHKDQVLHVSFSHNGKMFATCSKDGTVKVWSSSYPACLLYNHDMKDFSWKYTQYSNFNETDTLLLVSGVHFGNTSTSGEIAVFSLLDQFELQCRVLNKPYDVFGTWYDDTHLLSGSLHWTGQLNSCSALWLNKASQETESEHESVVMRLFRFNNINASSIRTVMISKCLWDTSAVNGEIKSEKTDVNSESKTKCLKSGANACSNFVVQRQDLGDKINGTIKYEPAYRKAEEELASVQQEEYLHNGVEEHLPCACCENSEEVAVKNNIEKYRKSVNNSHKRSLLERFTSSKKSDDKLLIFTMGSLTYTPHQIGIKRIKSTEAYQNFNLGQNYDGNGVRLPSVEDNNHGVNRSYDEVDEIFNMNGHIIGMSLSTDQRYLYVNSRPWPVGFEISKPLNPPPIAQEIDVHVIDLYKMEKVGTMLRSHKAYTPNDECFFIFLDVSDEYVASGAEDKHGYIWDRHYGTCLHRFPHTDVVNCVAFNPADPEVLVTVSDDNSIKVWRSSNKHPMVVSLKSNY